MKNIKIISKLFNLKFTNKDSVKNLEDFIWDSLRKITLITELDKKYKKTVDFKKLEKIRTLNQLDRLIENTIKKK
ncbi:acyl carrier protein [Candidatus Pelagibacter sp.]|nr:acyl carrier protein [Candidatus Pelagibacter sp.]